MAVNDGCRTSGKKKPKRIEDEMSLHLAGERVWEMTDHLRHAPISPVTLDSYPGSVGRYAFDRADEDIVTRSERSSIYGLQIRTIRSQ